MLNEIDLAAPSQVDLLGMDTGMVAAAGAEVAAAGAEAGDATMANLHGVTPTGAGRCLFCAHHDTKARLLCMVRQLSSFIGCRASSD
jgi:hypothetical protein